uniref:Uncharacterized protein n=2 Tax=Oryza TaxID=4527 RepID=A0A0D3HU39_9ORYZ
MANLQVGVTRKISHPNTKAVATDRTIRNLVCHEDLRLTCRNHLSHQKYRPSLLGETPRRSRRAKTKGFVTKNRAKPGDEDQWVRHQAW